MYKSTSYAFIIMLITVNVHPFDYRRDNIYVNSIPKCGTHLLTRCIELLTKRPLLELTEDLGRVAADQLPRRTSNEFLATHVKYSKKASEVFKKHKFKQFFIYRDPRDKIISQYFFIQAGGWMQQNFNNPLRKKSFDELLLYLFKKVTSDYEKFLPWMSDPTSCTVKFENLVGVKGGGLRAHQIKEIKKIASHIDLPLSNRLLQECIDSMFGHSVTFRSGKIGSWRKYFKPRHKKLFKQYAGKLLIKLGYEKDLNW